MQAVLSTTEATVKKDLAHSESQAQPSLLSLRTATRQPGQALQDAALVLTAAQGVLSGATRMSTVCDVPCQGTVAWQHAGPLSPRHDNSTRSSTLPAREQGGPPVLPAIRLITAIGAIHPPS